MAGCTQADCPVAKSGRCLEGHTDPASDCQFFTAAELSALATAVAGASDAGGPAASRAGAPDASGSQSSGAAAPGAPAAGGGATTLSAAGTGGLEAGPRKSGVAIHAGDTLNEGQATAMTRRSPTRVVMVVGPADSGKTTLVVSLYQLFLRGPVGPVRFAGSLTLPAFEVRSHDTRVTSQRETPTTPRTPLTLGTHFLHVRVAGSDWAQQTDLLLADIAGEAYRLAKDSEEEAWSLATIRRADFVVVLLDGKRLLDVAQRNGAIRDTREVLRSLRDAGMLTSTSRVQAVVTKWDVVEGDASAREVAAHALARMADDVRPAVADVSTHCVAALPGGDMPTARAGAPGAGAPFGFGLEALLTAWVATPEPFVLPPRGHSEVGAREFDRFADRFTDQYRPLENAALPGMADATSSCSPSDTAAPRARSSRPHREDE